ncbi:MAG: hypothetical protein ACK5QG_04875 [Bacteroidota bacterium]|jgi:hypothetical protein|nr:hypothetical protein [Flammeovirgaceae bacterium]
MNPKIQYMKAITWVLTVGWLLLACNKEERKALLQLPVGFPAKLKLVQTSGGMIPTTNIGDDMAWQETYTFQADGTFQKLRKVKDSGTEDQTNGSYSLLTVNSEKQLVLIYKNDNPLIANCTIETNEILVLAENNRVLNKDWQACDGFLLEYQWVGTSIDGK